jgi:protein SCO1
VPIFLFYIQWLLSSTVSDEVSFMDRVGKVNWIVWGGMLLMGAILVLAYALLRLRASTAQPLPVYGQIADFTLTNQNGRAVSLDDLRGRVWAADIIFTRCAGPCLKMSRQMRDLQHTLPPGSSAKLISLTTDPDFDTPPVLKTYGERFDASPDRWWFLTGTKDQIAKLATGSLKLTAIEKSPERRETPSDLFIHSTIMVLVDKQARLRGIYETMGEHIDPETVRGEILAAIKDLERER